MNVAGGAVAVAEGSTEGCSVVGRWGSEGGGEGGEDAGVEGGAFPEGEEGEDGG